jgi:hypothetical protein
MDLKSIDRRLDRAAAAAEPHPGRPYRLTTSENRTEIDRLVALTEIMFAVELVLQRLEEWACWRPDYAAAAKVACGANQPPDAARLGALLSQYRAAGVADESIETALADFRARLAAFEATGATIAPFYEKFLNPIAGNSAARSTEQKEEPPCL